MDEPVLDLGILFCIILAFYLFVRLLIVVFEIRDYDEEEAGNYYDYEEADEYYSDDDKMIELTEVVVVVDEEKVKRVTQNCTECTICLDSFDVEINKSHEKEGSEKKDKWVLKVCGHKFHGNCIITWFNHGNLMCPNCRRILPKMRFPLIYHDEISIEV
ncbi:uncharacterized protein LOC104893256 [Beta vulgaris subsp. vulgaris]|uniref:uncharacterized protein LOC104893256 n=1 Tax=Beta vulgaris subsp. vulgaris TaxID=3555 RepID=UPI002036837E|nr:uncharacterized protein LOC104893256 [Beta vulgaris subsp. vulgaris]